MKFPPSRSVLTLCVLGGSTFKGNQWSEGLAILKSYYAGLPSRVEIELHRRAKVGA